VRPAFDGVASSIEATPFEAGASGALGAVDEEQAVVAATAASSRRRNERDIQTPE